MNEEVYKKLNTYKRSLEEEKIIIVIYTIIFVFTVLVYDIFGISFFYKMIKLKINTVKDLQALNERLLQKKERIIFLENEIRKVNPYLRSMYSVISSAPDTEDYLISLVEVASRSGFKQKSFYIQSTNEDSVSIASSYEGDISQVRELIKNIESIKRLTRLEDFSVSYREGVTTITINSVIYFAKKDI